MILYILYLSLGVLGRADATIFRKGVMDMDVTKLYIPVGVLSRRLLESSRLEVF